MSETYSNRTLSFDQGPPLRAPLRFLLTAPGLLLAAALLAAFDPSWILSRWLPLTLVITHLLTIGFLAMVMCGALLQMLPVVIGQPVPHVLGIATFTHTGLSVGVIALAAGFTSNPLLLTIGAGVLGLSFTIFLVAISISLLRARPARRETAAAMRLSWMALVTTVIAGIALAGGMSGRWGMPNPLTTTQLHATMGLFGWVSVLVVGVSYQVVPMFQLTPPYPNWLMRLLSITLPTTLVLAGTNFVLGWPLIRALASLVGGISLIIFAVVTLLLQQRRRRKVADIILSFWRIAMPSLAVCGLLGAWPFPDLWMEYQERVELAGALLFILGFATSVVCGMLYKIIPFLAWFHLQTQATGKVPFMKAYVRERIAHWQLYTHLAAVLLMLVAILGAWPEVARIGALLLAVSAVLLIINLTHATRVYRQAGGRY